MTKPNVLLFDLGGVIVRWVGLDALAQMTNQSREDVSKHFAASPIFQAYETGRCGDDVFVQDLIKTFNLNLTATQAKELWKSWVQESYFGTKEMLMALRRDYTIACLSNTNALHWEHLPVHIKLEDYFDYSFASHLIHAAKPALKSYQITCEEMGVRPEDIWFFDDTIINIKAATTAGLHAHHVDRAHGVIPTLQSLGLIEA